MHKTDNATTFSMFCVTLILSGFMKFVALQFYKNQIRQGDTKDFWVIKLTGSPFNIPTCSWAKNYNHLIRNYDN